jgi:hypothetical protein
MTALAAGASQASQVLAGTLGFLVVAAMGIALVFLFRSMNKQLRKVVPDPEWRRAAAKPGEPGKAQASGEAPPPA